MEVSARGPFVKNWLWLALLVASCRPSPQAPLRVAAASDLTDAFTELGVQFEADTGIKVIFSFGSSGLLAKQLSEGAPFDLFAAANTAFVEQAVRAGACERETIRPLAQGQLAAWSLTKPLVAIDALSADSTRKVALANPEHAPYGRAAKEALERSGLWPELASRAVYGENVSQALQLAATGNAEVALVAYANVIHRKQGHTLLIDQALYNPIRQSLVRCTRGAQPRAAMAFDEYLTGEGANTLMRKFGFKVEADLGTPLVDGLGRIAKPAEPHQ